MTPAQAPFETKAFRRALGNFATGVTIVTAAAGRRKAGVTANSFNSVSLDPPLVLWSIDKRSSSQEVFEQSAYFAVNILAADQIELSNRFARPQDDKFAGVEYTTGEGGTPLFADCAARFQCAKKARIDGGDHWILLGQVLVFEDFGRSPLLYHQGAYSTVLPHPRMNKKAERDEQLGASQGGLSDNLYYLMTQAVRSYQAEYQPRQLSTGLRTSEARLLLVLGQDELMSMQSLLREVAMPQREIEEALSMLQRKGWLVTSGDSYGLSIAGREHADMLWHIAEEQQRKAFAQFSSEQLQAFKTVLKGVMVQG